MLDLALGIASANFWNKINGFYFYGIKNVKIHSFAVKKPFKKL